MAFVMLIFSELIRRKMKAALIESWARGQLNEIPIEKSIFIKRQPEEDLHPISFKKKNLYPIYPTIGLLRCPRNLMFVQLQKNTPSHQILHNPKPIPNIG